LARIIKRQALEHVRAGGGGGGGGGGMKRPWEEVAALDDGQEGAAAGGKGASAHQLVDQSDVGGQLAPLTRAGDQRERRFKVKVC
jgi:hypothetical protein